MATTAQLVCSIIETSWRHATPKSQATRNMPGGDTVAVGAVGHAVHHPLAAGADALPRRLRQLHPNRRVGRRGDRGHLRDFERRALESHQGLPELPQHPLHLLEVAPRHGLRRGAPVQRVSPDAQAAVRMDAAVLHLHRSRNKIRRKTGREEVEEEGGHKTSTTASLSSKMEGEERGGWVEIEACMPSFSSPILPSSLSSLFLFPGRSRGYGLCFYRDEGGFHVHVKLESY
ncbi:hypothetical protein GW17_00048556 [Ensete ventricosum]|nr:hypothetical protein GW17_00048556 [Ensete ventricosum]